MSLEYRIELAESVDRKAALELLAKSRYFHNPGSTGNKGEVWLRKELDAEYSVRLFPRSYGFFLETTILPTELLKCLESWIRQLRTLGDCSIVDNDDDEIIDVSMLR